MPHNFRINFRLRDFFPVALVAAVSFFAWRRILDLSIRGDGFVYLVERLQRAYWRPPETFAGLEVGSVFLGKVMTPFFGANIEAYYLVVLITIILINVLFFYMVKAVTGKRVIAFAASLLLSVNFFGNAEMYTGGASGMYSYYLDRVPDMLFLLPAFSFLHLYLEKKKSKYWALSLALYFFGVFIAHWSFIFTGLFLFYPFFWFLYNDRNKLLSGIKLGLPYLFITAFFAILQESYQAGLGPDWSFREFVLNPAIHRYPEKMIRQLIYWSEYTPILKGFMFTPLRYANTPIHYLANVKNAIPLQPYVIFIYSIAAFIIYKLLPRYRPLLATLILAVASMLFLNAYIGQYQIFAEPGTNRYLYPPTFLLVIFWALFLYAVFWRSVKLKFVFWSTLVLYLAVGLVLIWNHFYFIEENHTVTRKVWDEILKVSKGAEEGSIIIIPYYETGRYEAEFLNDWLGKKQNVRFISSDMEEAETLQGNVIEVTYDKECECAKSNLKTLN